jgi:NAD(P)-dependent dehydrogenase (short-subunit alcohol dehydrogenase family)
MKRLSGKVAIVTGCGRGIGKDVAELFAEEGATVVATSRSMEPGVRDDMDCRPLDVASEQQWIDLVAAVVARYGRVDVLVNNAGIIAYETLHELSVNEWNAVVATNQTGVWIGMREVIPHMIAQGGGSIINVSSIWGTVAVSGAHAYHATKGAVRNMSKSAAISYATDSIRVNSVHPGFIRTPLTEAQAPEVNEYVVSQTPMGRAGEPREVANCILFLASDESSFVTGSELVVDGGYLAQ